MQYVRISILLIYFEKSTLTLLNGFVLMKSSDIKRGMLMRETMFSTYNHTLRYCLQVRTPPYSVSYPVWGKHDNRDVFDKYYYIIIYCWRWILWKASCTLLLLFALFCTLGPVSPDSDEVSDNYMPYVTIWQIKFADIRTCIWHICLYPMTCETEIYSYLTNKHMIAYQGLYQVVFWWFYDC